MKAIRQWIGIAGVLAGSWLAHTVSAQDIMALEDGYLTFENADTSLYYRVEFRPNLTGPEPWDGAYRGLRNIQSSAPTVTVPIGAFYRVVGRPDPYVSGTATAADILTGKTAYVSDEEVAGTMPDQSARGFMPGASDVAIPGGYYGGAGVVTGDAALVTGNIRAGAAIFGVTGMPEVVDTTSGDAVAGDVMAGKKVWVDGAEVAGTLPTYTLSGTTTAVTAGYYEATTLTAVDADLATGNIRSGVTIFGVDGKPEVVDTTSGNAAAGEVMAGKKVWVGGAEVTGTLPTRMLSATTAVVSAGYYDATILTAVDGDLAAENIRAGVTMFGVTGTYEFVGVIGTPKTGQTNSYRIGDDGDLERGISGPVPRFTVITSGAHRVVTDDLTGLMWVRQPHALAGNSYMTNWAPAVDFCTGLVYAGYADWRLPNLRELHSLVDYDHFNSPLPTGHPFVGIQLGWYWTGTTAALFTNYAWYVSMTVGEINTSHKEFDKLYVWPVRGGP